MVDTRPWAEEIGEQIVEETEYEEVTVYWYSMSEQSGDIGSYRQWVYRTKRSFLIWHSSCQAWNSSSNVSIDKRFPGTSPEGR
jgi:hypothetical protein